MAQADSRDTDGRERAFACVEPFSGRGQWTQRRIERVGDKFEDLFNRVPNGWPARDFWSDLGLAFEMIVRGEIRFQLLRLPVAACASAARMKFVATQGESAEHKRMKQAAWLWMRGAGADDAAFECGHFAGRSDVRSLRTDWIVECGHTRMSKLASAVAYMPLGRFTLLPYQALEWQGGEPRSLIAVDFTWSRQASQEVADYLDEQRSARVASLARKMGG